MVSIRLQSSYVRLQFGGTLKKVTSRLFIVMHLCTDTSLKISI